MKATVAPYETTAWCVRIECKNGTIIRLTTYPRDLTMSNATVYTTDSGYEATAYTGSSSMQPSAIDLEGIIGLGGVTRDQIASGVFDNARVKIFKCNFLSPVEDYEPVTAGFFGKTTIQDDRYKIEGMSLVDALNQSVGKSYTASCSRTYGDTGCQINLATVTATGTLTGVTSNYVVQDTSRTEAEDWFGAGTIVFTSGNNIGLKPLEIKSYNVNGTITTFEPFYYTPVIGDAYSIVKGCRKRLVDCQANNNVINFFGFSYIPTSSTYATVGGQK